MRVYGVVSLQCIHLGVEVAILLLQSTDMHVSVTDILDPGCIGLLDEVEETTMLMDESGSKQLDLCVFAHASNRSIDAENV